jgi:hypothetical protein
LSVSAPHSFCLDGTLFEPYPQKAVISRASPTGSS